MSTWTTSKVVQDFVRTLAGSVLNANQHSAAVHPRVLVRRALEHNAAAIILAHNHPSGVLDPSEADKRITNRLKEALQLIDVRTLDHIIVTSNGCKSFAEEGLL
ncbi:JAB domain-containing protein [Spongiibacter pelagi]